MTINPEHRALGLPAACWLIQRTQGQRSPGKVLEERLYGKPAGEGCPYSGYLEKQVCMAGNRECPGKTIQA